MYEVQRKIVTNGCFRGLPVAMKLCSKDLLIKQWFNSSMKSSGSCCPNLDFKKEKKKVTPCLHMPIHKYIRILVEKVLFV